MPKNEGYNKRPIWHWVLLYAIIGIIVYGFVYFFVLAKKGNYVASQNISPTEAPNTAGSSESNTAQISVQGNEFAFMPSTLDVKLGQPVTLTFENTGKYPHNFVISDLNVQSKKLMPGESDTVTFTPTKAGSFPYLCTIPGHADKGMKGTITVQ